MQSSKGFTLIEILVALAILSIATTAVIKAVGQAIRGSSYLKTKSLALWLAEDLTHEIQLGLYKPSYGNDNGKRQVGSQQLYYTAKIAASANKNIKLIQVNITTDRDHIHPLITLKSFMYVAQAT